MRSVGDGGKDLTADFHTVPHADSGAVGEDDPPARILLDRTRIVAAGLTFIDREGLARLTMRQLGGSLGVEAMSLYRYVSGKEDVLDGIVDALLNELNSDEHVRRTPESSWQDFAQRLARGVRRIALAHPKAFPLIFYRPTEEPWLRPPLRSLEWSEIFLAGLILKGFEPVHAVAAYRAFNSFLLGHLLAEVSNNCGQPGPTGASHNELPTPRNIDDYPVLRSLREELCLDHAAQEFDTSLKQLLDRFDSVADTLQ